MKGTLKKLVWIQRCRGRLYTEKKTQCFELKLLCYFSYILAIILATTILLTAALDSFLVVFEYNVLKFLSHDILLPLGPLSKNFSLDYGF